MTQTRSTYKELLVCAQALADSLGHEPDCHYTFRATNGACKCPAGKIQAEALANFNALKTEHQTYADACQLIEGLAETDEFKEKLKAQGLKLNRASLESLKNQLP